MNKISRRIRVHCELRIKRRTFRDINCIGVELAIALQVHIVDLQRILLNLCLHINTNQDRIILVVVAGIPREVIIRSFITGLSGRVADTDTLRLIAFPNRFFIIGPSEVRNSNCIARTRPTGHCTSRGSHLINLITLLARENHGAKAATTAPIAINNRLRLQACCSRIRRVKGTILVNKLNGDRATTTFRRIAPIAGAITLCAPVSSIHMQLTLSVFIIDVNDFHIVGNKLISVTIVRYRTAITSIGDGHLCTIHINPCVREDLPFAIPIAHLRESSAIQCFIVALFCRLELCTTRTVVGLLDVQNLGLPVFL